MGSGVRGQAAGARLSSEVGARLGPGPPARSIPRGLGPWLRPRPRRLDEGRLQNLTLRLRGPCSPSAPPPPPARPGSTPDAEVTYTDVLGQGDHPLVTFDPRRSLEQRAGGGLALGQRPQVREVRGLAAQLPGACGQSGAGQGGVGPGASVFRSVGWGHAYARGAVGGLGVAGGGGPTWLLVPQVPLQVALVQLLEVLGEPLVVGQARGAHGADGLHPVRAVAAAVVTCSGRAWGQASGCWKRAAPGLPGLPRWLVPRPEPGIWADGEGVTGAGAPRWPGLGYTEEGGRWDSREGERDGGE